MKEVIHGLIDAFNTTNDFNSDVSGRLFYGMAPEGTNLSEGPYAVFFIISDVDDDPLSERMREVAIQFSLFSGDSSAAKILDMETHLVSLFKDVTFTVSGWTVINMYRTAAIGPRDVPADTEAGTGRYWQTDIDYLIQVKK